MINIIDVSIEKTNDNKQFDVRGKNWFIKIKFNNKKQFGVELKPEMGIAEIVFELIKFTNLLITKTDE